MRAQGSGSREKNKYVAAESEIKMPRLRTVAQTCSAEIGRATEQMGADERQKEGNMYRN